MNNVERYIQLYKLNYHLIGLNNRSVNQCKVIDELDKVLDVLWRSCYHSDKVVVWELVGAIDSQCAETARERERS